MSKLAPPVAPPTAPQQQHLQTFEIGRETFLLDGKPLRLLSGAMHYFRVLPEQWDNRLAKLKALGLNCVETYVAWNLHEPRSGQFDFSGRCDLVAFLERVQAHGLYAIVRPGPYICAEWEFGGLPAWLLKDPEMQLRCSYGPYLAAVDSFFDALIPQLVPLQLSQGGPLLMVQIENEYGSYGSDKGYLRHLEAGLKARGLTCPLFTSDGPTNRMLETGTLESYLKTVNFGSRAPQAFAKLAEHQDAGPPVCMEFWNGWFDHWGEPHHTRSADDAAQSLDEILAAAPGASVNFYMLHGGTNFGFMNGANTDPKTGYYQPTVTSYDYDAAIGEAGELTPKYHAFREVLGRYTVLPQFELPPEMPRLELPPLSLDQTAPLFGALDRLSRPTEHISPLPMEALDQAYGFVLYRTRVESRLSGKVTLTVAHVHDRAQVFVDGYEVGVLERNDEQGLVLDLPGEPFTLELLVENLGRVNYGPQLHDRKGLLGSVRLDYTHLTGWTMFPLPLDDLSGLEFGTVTDMSASSGPTFYRTRLSLEEPADTFVDMSGWCKGVVWVNGFNLGRYWDRGPQRTLYLPAPLLHQGDNELVVLELHGAGDRQISFRESPNLG